MQTKKSSFLGIVSINGSQYLCSRFVSEDEEVLTDGFFELGAKIAYGLHLYKHYELELNCGVKNVLNQFQRDLDKGMNRDASYIYGPAQPRTWFVGLNLKL
jgi:outer membrane receptor for ferrienterochelin and colicins